MQYKTLTIDQKVYRSWRMKRNHIVCELLANDPSLTRLEAWRLAHKQCPPPKKKCRR